MTTEITRYERNGRVWECGTHEYVYYGDEPCVQFDMRGDPVGFFSDDTIIVAVAEFDDGWARYWYQSSNVALQDNTAELARLYAYGRSRGWNK